MIDRAIMDSYQTRETKRQTKPTGKRDQKMKRLSMIKIVKEKTVAYESTNRINSCHDAWAILKNVIEDADRENFVVLFLNTKHMVIAAEIIAIGTINACLVHPREVFKAACMMNATTLVLAHNHPSGDTEPSAEDIELTKRLMQASEIMGIGILDHIIIGDNSFKSIREQRPDIWIGK